MKVRSICFYFIFFFIAVSNAFASKVTSDLRCFVETSAKKIKLEMRLYSDETHNWTGGYVKYGKNRTPISIVFHATKPIDQSSGRPSYFESTWIEIASAEVAGKYTIGTQGANVYSLEYVGRDLKKKYSFDETTERNSTDDECKW